MKSLRYLVFALVLVAASCKNPALPQGATVSFEGAAGLTGGKIVKTDAAPAFTIVARKTAKAGDDGTVEYTSGDTEKATVNKTSGQVTIVGAEAGKVAEVIITATKKATAKFAESKATYTIVIQPGVKLSYAETEVQLSISDTAANNAKYTHAITKSPTVAGATTHSGSVTYAITEAKDGSNSDISSDHSAVFAFNKATGEFTFKGVKGSAKVTATKSAANGYKESTASYTLTIGD